MVVIAITAVILGYVVYVQIAEISRDSYAQWRVADILIDHMERNGGAWPQNWENLRESYDIVAGHSGQAWSFDELQKRVAIQFDANPGELQRVSKIPDKPPFTVIYLRNGKQHWWSGHEPNSMVLDYLLERAARPATCQYPKHPVPEEEPSRRGLSELGAQWELDREGRIVIVKMASPQGNPLYSDAGMVHLKTLKQLRELDLGYSDITNDGLASIEDATELRSLYLYGTKVTDDGLRHLHHLDKLDTLVLASSNFSDTGLQELGSLPSLKLLNLNGARVTDVGLDCLHNAHNLRELMLYTTQVTDEGAKKLQRALPGCKIER